MENPNQLLSTIARNHLSIETLETRHSDSLDFHNVAVWAVRDALAAAYEAGHEKAARALVQSANTKASRDTLRFVAQELAGFKPDYLRQLGLNVMLEQVEKTLALAEATATANQD